MKKEEQLSVLDIPPNVLLTPLLYGMDGANTLNAFASGCKEVPGMKHRYADFIVPRLILKNGLLYTWDLLKEAAIAFEGLFDEKDFFSVIREINDLTILVQIQASYKARL